MATKGLEVTCEPHIFDGTHFAQWKTCMSHYFHTIDAKLWWIISVGFYKPFDENTKDLTQEKEKCLHLEHQATNILYQWISDKVFKEIMYMETAHDIWTYLDDIYGRISSENVEHIHNTVVVKDCFTSWSSDDDERHTTSSLDNDDCVGSNSSDANDGSISSILDDYGDCSCSDDDIATTSPSITPHCFMSQGNKKVYNANVTNHSYSYDELVGILASMNIALEIEKDKTRNLENENSFLKYSCEQQKHLLYVVTCSHEELKLSHEELSVAHENLIQEHAFLTNEISSKENKTSENSSHELYDQLKKVANPCDEGKKHVPTYCDDLLAMPCSSTIDYYYSSLSCGTNLLKENNKLKNKVKNLSNMFERWHKSKVTHDLIMKNQRRYDDKSGLGFNKSNIKGRQLKLKGNELSHFMCYKCHEMGHLAKACPNKRKLKLKKEERRLKHDKCFKCHTWGHLTSMCPTKKLVNPQVKPQPKSRVEQKKNPQKQIKINHEYNGDVGKTRRERRRHSIYNQYDMMSTNQKKKDDLAQIKWYMCDDMGHFASRCPNNLEKKAQANEKRQDNVKQNLRKKEKAQTMRTCYTCRERGHMANSCPLGNNSKPILIHNNIMLRKDGNGTSFVAIAKHPAIHTKAMPKYVAPNLRGPNLVWVPSKHG